MNLNIFEILRFLQFEQKTVSKDRYYRSPNSNISQIFFIFAVFYHLTVYNTV